MKRLIGFLLVGLLVLVTSCSEQPATNSPAPASASKATAVSTQIFQVKGVVVAVKPNEKTVRIRHEEIPGYMEAMTMPFEVKDTKELAGVSEGDTVTFRMLVTEADGWIDQIKKLEGAAAVNALPANTGIRIVRDVEPLEVGNVLPDYTFTNQHGKAVSLSQFRGKAVAFTFIFTRCPFPTFCPLMSNNFRAVRDALTKDPNAPANWHLLTISFDPEFDTPERLRAYSAGYGADPANWSFLTGTLVDITALSEQVGLQFWREPGGNINHNLRTVVVDAQGRLQKIYPENKWTVEELTGEIIKAAGAK